MNGPGHGRAGRRYVVYEALPCCGRGSSPVRFEVERNQVAIRRVTCRRCGRRWVINARIGRRVEVTDEPSGDVEPQRSHR